VRILVSNDDGYFSPGISMLAEALRPVGDVTVVAPERDRSGASNSLTLDRPLAVRQAANGFYFVNGTPTDCVHLAVTGLLAFVPDMVVSGINLETAAQVALEMALRFARAPLGEPVLLNVNVPDIPPAQLQGIEATRLGRRHKAESVVRVETPRGDTGYWIGPAGGAADAGPGTDFHAIEHARASVTPLQVDLTFHGQLARLPDWLLR